jgi:hypothetical protein
MLTVVCADGESFSLDEQYASYIGVVNNLVKDVGVDLPIELKEVHSREYKIIEGFLPILHEHFAELSARMGLKKEKRRPYDYELEYFDKITDPREFITLMNTVNWLTTPESKTLLQCCMCAYSWRWIRNMTPDQIREKWAPFK